MKVAIVEFEFDESGDISTRTMHRYSTAQELEAGWEILKKKKNSWFYTVNCSTASPKPPLFDMEAQGLGDYCPYCSHERLFIHSADTGEEHCNVCRISSNDFYVRKYNPRFDAAKMRRAE